MPARTVRQPLRITDLKPDPHNANRGTERGRAALAESLRAFGGGRGVVLDRHGTIIAGNKTIEQAKALGMPLHVVQTDGTYLVAVQRNDLDLRTDSRATGLALADNRVGELGLEWDVEMLKQLHADGLDLSAFWTDAEFADLLNDATGGLTDDNAVVEPGPTDIVRGELFVLGSHRLLCGDATSAGDVARVLDGIEPVLMVTDPPYGVLYHSGLVRGRMQETVAEDADAVAAANYPEPVEHCDVCPWSSDCSRKRRADDHLSLVAGISRLQRRELEERGVSTLADLAKVPLPLPFKPRRGGIDSYLRVREQARVQFESRGKTPPVYELRPFANEEGLYRLSEERSWGERRREATVMSRSAQRAHVNVELVSQNLKRQSIMGWPFRPQRLRLVDDGPWRGPSPGIPGAKRFDGDTESRRALRLGQAESRADLPQG